MLTRIAAALAAALLSCAPVAAQRINTVPLAQPLTGAERITAAQGSGCATNVAPCAAVAVQPAQIATFLAPTFQPLDTDLTAIAALSTADFGRQLLTRADAASVRAAIGSAPTADPTFTGVVQLAEMQLAGTRTTGTTPLALMIAGKTPGNGGSIGYRRTLASQQLFVTFESVSASSPDAFIGLAAGVQKRLVVFAGTGVNSDAQIAVDQTAGLLIGTVGNATALTISPAGAITPGTDNAAAIGSTAKRMQAVYATQLRPGAGAAIWTSGTGSPLGVVVAPVGSLYTRTDGGAGSTLYVKESGTDASGWVAK